MPGTFTIAEILQSVLARSAPDSPEYIAIQQALGVIQAVQTSSTGTAASADDFGRTYGTGEKSFSPRY